MNAETREKTSGSIMALKVNPGNFYLFNHLERKAE